MEYQFDYATFCKTFNVKDDKAIDSLRLTHTQDINFKLFPYKASGKTQAPIITELEEVVSDFFRKSLNWKVNRYNTNPYVIILLLKWTLKMKILKFLKK